MNRKIKSKRRPQKKERKRSASPFDELREQEFRLKAEVDNLERFIVGAPERTRRHDIRNENTLAPPEELRDGLVRPRQKLVSERHRDVQARRQHCAQFFFLLGLLTAVLAWLMIYGDLGL